MKSESDSWYVRDDDATTGPFTLAELQVRGRDGALEWCHEVSQDQVHWIKALAIVDIPLATAPPRRNPPPWAGTWTATRQRTALTIGAVGVALVLGLTWIGRSDGTMAGEAGAIQRVLRADDAAAKQYQAVARAKGIPSVYARAIGRYLARMRQVNMDECPAEFRIAFKHHLDAWQELREAVAKQPDNIFENFIISFQNGYEHQELDGGRSRMGKEVEQASKKIHSTFQDVEAIAARYGVVVD